MLFWIGAFEHDRERHGEIRRERKGAAVERDGFLRQRILKHKQTAPTLKVRDDGDAVENARRREVLARVLVDLTLRCNDRRSDAGARGALGDVLSVNIELVRRCEVVERGIPLWTGVGLVRQHELAALARHCQWLCPGIELCVVDDLKDAAQREVVIA